MCAGSVPAPLDLGGAVCTAPRSFRRLGKRGALQGRSAYVSLGAGEGGVETTIGAQAGAACGSSEEAEVVKQMWDCVTGARDGCFS